MVAGEGFEPATPWSQTKCSTKLSHFPIIQNGAPDRNRTHNLLVRSQTLYPIELRAHQLSKKWWLRVESNHRHRDFQSLALPTELQRHIEKVSVATRKRLELSTSCVTGRRSNQLNYRATNGGNNRARTYDPLLVRQMLSQLSYAPITSSTIDNVDNYSKTFPKCQ